MQEHVVRGKLEASRDCSEDQAGQFDKTLMIRNLPTFITSKDFMNTLDAIGLSGTYDYVFMPRCHRKRNSKGYVFVHFSANVVPSELLSALSSMLRKKDKLAIVLAKHQGVLKNLEHMVSVGLGMMESSEFENVWVRVDGVMKPMSAPIAYESFKIMDGDRQDNDSERSSTSGD
jgi:hypothetical protein